MKKFIILFAALALAGCVSRRQYRRDMAAIVQGLDIQGKLDHLFADAIKTHSERMASLDQRVGALETSTHETDAVALMRFDKIQDSIDHLAGRKGRQFGHGKLLEKTLPATIPADAK